MKALDECILLLPFVLFVYVLFFVEFFLNLDRETWQSKG